MAVILTEHGTNELVAINPEGVVAVTKGSMEGSTKIILGQSHSIIVKGEFQEILKEVWGDQNG